MLWRMTNTPTANAITPQPEDPKVRIERLVAEVPSSGMSTAAFARHVGLHGRQGSFGSERLAALPPATEHARLLRLSPGLETVDLRPALHLRRGKFLREGHTTGDRRSGLSPALSAATMQITP
jgi:hypothetical protein